MMTGRPIAAVSAARRRRRLLAVVLALLLAAAAAPPLAAAAKAKDTRRCGRAAGAICCEAWGNACVDDALSCCDGRQCSAVPFNASAPLAGCPALPAPNTTRSSNSSSNNGSSAAAASAAGRPLCPLSKLLRPTRAFSSANAWVLAVLATSVYPTTWALPDNDTLVGSAWATWASGLGLANATFLEARTRQADTEGVCARDDAGNVFIVFRGTSSAADVATDADVFGSLHPQRNNMFGGKGVNLHDGFTEAYKPVREQTIECAKKFVALAEAAAARGNKTATNGTAKGAAAAVKPMLWVGGHSLGGALALLAAADLKRAGLSPVLYTIGGPRVGDKDWAELYDDELGLKGSTFRLVNGQDPVARVPWRSLGYRHVGTAVDLLSGGGGCGVGAGDHECEPGACVASQHYTDSYLNHTYACVAADKSIDLNRCPQEALLEPINYDLKAADPGAAGTMADSPEAAPPPPKAAKSGAALGTGACAGAGAAWAAGAALALLVSRLQGGW